MSVRHSPTVRRRRLGAELRRLREAAGMTCEQAGEHLDCSSSKISRMETARVPARTVDVQVLCHLYRASEELTATLISLARESKQAGWWQQYDVLPDWFETYVGLEAAAATIRTYEIQLIPGLLQTPDYARALFEHSELNGPREVERSVSVRRARQEILKGDPVPQYWAILSEAALQRMVGGREVMRDQLRHLCTMGGLSNVTIQVIPNSAGAHPGMTTPFVILGFADREDPQIAFLDYLTGALYLEKLNELSRYELVFNHLVAVAMPPRQSVEFIEFAASQLA
jgi:transcriptional regulator with XRE-family HTH domain